MFTTETRRSEETVFWLLTSDLTPCSPCLRGEWFEFGFGILFILFFLSKFLGIFYPQMTQIYTDKHTPADWHLCSSVTSVDNNGLDKEEESYTEGTEDHGD